MIRMIINEELDDGIILSCDTSVCRAGIKDILRPVLRERFSEPESSKAQ